MGTLESQQGRVPPVWCPGPPHRPGVPVHPAGSSTPRGPAARHPSSHEQQGMLVTELETALSLGRRACLGRGAGVGGLERAGPSGTRSVQWARGRRGLVWGCQGAVLDGLRPSALIEKCHCVKKFTNYKTFEQALLVLSASGVLCSRRSWLWPIAALVPGQPHAAVLALRQVPISCPLALVVRGGGGVTVPFPAAVRLAERPRGGLEVRTEPGGWEHRWGSACPSGARGVAGTASGARGADCRAPGSRGGTSSDFQGLWNHLGSNKMSMWADGGREGPRAGVPEGGGHSSSLVCTRRPS